MQEIAQIAPLEALKMMEERGAWLVDIRDPQSFAQAHPRGAFHLSDGSLVSLMQQTEFETPLIVMCYHGISSVGAAQYLHHQGYEEVYNLQGGFEEWRKVAEVEQGE